MSLRVTLKRDEAQWRSSNLQAGLRQLVSLKFEKECKEFTGKTTIYLTCLNTVEGLWLEYVGKSIELLLIDGEFQKVNWCGKRLQLPSLTEGSHTVEIHFTSEVTNRGVGIHHYHDPENLTDYYYSNLCPYDAGKIFPCFDQPDLKACFELSVNLPKEWSVIANSSKLTEILEGKLKNVHFKPTPPISSYLFALCFGDYQKVEGPLVPVSMNIYCRSEKLKDVEADYIFRIINDARKFYEGFFGTEFGFDKYDQVFVPEFNWGAMENVGCVVLREEMLFSSLPSRKELFSRDNTLVHELAHMWFGNLVTMDWWDDLWLNEAFATLMAYICLERTGHHEDSSLYFHYEVQVEAKEQDSFRSTHPVVVDCVDTDEAFQNFDAITYLKGASVLKQLLYYVGEQEFREGLHSFFNEFAYGNANLQQFLDNFGTTDLSDWSNQWLHTVGFNRLKAIRTDDGLEILQSSDKGPEFRTRSFLVQAWSLSDGGKITWERKVKMGKAHITLQVPSDQVDLWILNGSDNDLNQMELDSISFDNLSNYLSSIKSDILKLQLCTSLFEMVEEGRLAIKSFYSLFRSTLIDDSSSFVGRVCLERLSPYLGCAEMRLEKSEVVNSLDRQFKLTEGEFGTYCFGKLILLASTEIERLGLQEYLALDLNEDQRLQLLGHMAAMPNQVGQDALKELRGYQSHKARGIYAKALVASSRGECREKYFDSFYTDQKSSLHELSAQMSGFFISGLNVDLDSYATKYYQMLGKVESERDQNFLKRYFIDFHPGRFIKIGLSQVASLLDLPQSAVMRRQLIQWQDFFMKKKKIYDSNKFIIDS